jgi:hypothetical protein
MLRCVRSGQWRRRSRKRSPRRGAQRTGCRAVCPARGLPAHRCVWTGIGRWGRRCMSRECERCACRVCSLTRLRMEWRGRGVRDYAKWRSNLREDALIIVFTVTNGKSQPSRNHITTTWVPHHVSCWLVAPFHTTVHAVVRHRVQTGASLHAATAFSRTCDVVPCRASRGMVHSGSGATPFFLHRHCGAVRRELCK